MEDASDFSFESARACHAVVLTTMEQDKFSYFDVNELDRCRRNHAQRHYQPVSNSRQSTQNAKKSAQNSRNGSNNRQAKNAGNGAKFCVYYNDGYCKRLKSHNSGGTFYKNLCENCSGEHAAVNCPPQAKN